MKPPPAFTAATWTEQAMCGGGDPAAWELVSELDDPAKLTAANLQAIVICGLCPVRRECLAEAVDFGDRGVIRGGVPLWSAHEWFTCETCGARGVRSTSKRPDGARKRFCDDCRHLPRLDPHECGTPWSFRKHLRRGEPVCEPCRDARNDYQADRSKEKRARQRAVAA